MLDNNRGAVSLLALGIMAFLGILLAAVAFAVSMETGHGKINNDMVQARYAAEAGAKRALSVFQDGKNGAADWGWIQINANPAWNNLFADANIRYTVLIRKDNQNGAIIAAPGARPADGVYFIEATGQVGNVSQKYSLSVTIVDPPLPPEQPQLPQGMRYVVESVRKSVQQAKSKNWKREGGKQYNADSWNGLAELILQEGSTTLVAAADLKYDGSGDKTKWGSNWHYGRPAAGKDGWTFSAKSIVGTLPATYSLQTGHPQDTQYMSQDTDYKNFTNTADSNDDTGDNWNKYSQLDGALWDGQPTVYAGAGTSLSSLNGNNSMKPYFPPWVLLTTNRDFSPENIDKIINSTSTSVKQKQSALKAVLGTIVVFRNDSATGAPDGNPVQIYHINVDKATGAITRSPTNLASFSN